MTLLMRDAENIEKGIEKGMRQGIEKGKIYGTISVYRELGMPEQEIAEKIQKKFNLTSDEAASYLTII